MIASVLFSVTSLVLLAAKLLHMKQLIFSLFSLIRHANAYLTGYIREGLVLMFC